MRLSFGYSHAVVIALLAISTACSFDVKAQDELSDTLELPDVESLLENFEDIVFGSEIKFTSKVNNIRKWDGPLRVTLVAYEEQELLENGIKSRVLAHRSVDADYIKYIKTHLNSLAKLTGLRTEDSKTSGKRPNVKITFVPRLHMANPQITHADPAVLRRLASHEGCYFLVWSNSKTGALFRADIVVNSDRKKQSINHCLLEEMVQSMGMPNDIKTKWPSVFSDQYKISKLSVSDEVLIKTLYDKRMKLATPKAEALEIARRIIAEYSTDLNKPVN